MGKHLRAAAALAALVVVIAPGRSVPAGASTSAGNSTSGCPGDPPNQIYHPNKGGTPISGGTLNVLGTGDVDDALDTNIGYTPVDSLAYMLYSRSLYSYPSIECQTFQLAPDLATAAPVVSDGGLKYAVTIRSGAMWDTDPPRQVTAADVVRGVKRSCNPTESFPGQADFSGILVGYQQFCSAFESVSPTSAAAQKAYIDSHNIAGVQVDPSNPLTVDFTVTQPTSNITGVLALAAFNPVPAETLAYLPASPAMSAHIYSDGPYALQSYAPGSSIVFVRNGAWNQASDPIRHAYPSQIDISETGTQQGVYQEIMQHPSIDEMQWDTTVPPAAIPGLIAAKDPRFQLLTESALDSSIVFNTISKNNNGAMGKFSVRRALAFAINRSKLIHNHGGSAAAPPLTHLIPPGTDGSSPGFNDYPYDPTKAKKLLAAAGASHLTLTFLYRAADGAATKDFETLQNGLANFGVTLRPMAVSDSDFYSKYLDPGTAAKNSVWDLAEGGRGPDWFPAGAESYFLPRLSCNALPPASANFGFFCDPKADSLYTQALAATSESAAATLWHQADAEVMSQAAVYPIADTNAATIHSLKVHNCVFIAALRNCDLANVWLHS